MCTTLSSAYQRLGGIFGIASPAPPKKEIGSKTPEVMRKVLAAKEANVNQALNNKWQRYNPIFISGDFFTIGYLGFQGVHALMPSVQNIAAIGAVTLVCGVIAGAINVGVGIVSLFEAIQALKNGDTLLGVRLMLDFFCCTAIGTIMILASLAIQVSVLGGISAFFASNPWFLPVLFFIITIPLLYELSLRIKKIQTAQDLGSQLKLDELQTLLKAEDLDWKKIDGLYAGKTNPFNFKALEECDPKERPKILSTKMEELQAEMGAEAALVIFDLLLQIQQRNQKEALKNLTVAKQRIAEWNHSLYVRMAQQVLYLIGFCISMAALSPKANANLLNGTQSFFLLGANVIPLYMDSFWPFKRNTPIVVPKVEENSIKI